MMLNSKSNPQAAQGYEREFEQHFKQYFKPLYAYACTILKSAEAAEEAVQSVFAKLWERQVSFGELSSVKAYLYRAVYNESIDQLRRRSAQNSFNEQMTTEMNTDSYHSDTKVLLQELDEKIRAGLNALPEQCRTIFQMSRFEELKYGEIAAQLGLSVKTVEAQMGKALHRMRQQLREYL
jgi:RNA polymerase sigma-70 factor (ECF subfamily)